MFGSDVRGGDNRRKKAGLADQVNIVNVISEFCSIFALRRVEQVGIGEVLGKRDAILIV